MTTEFGSLTLEQLHAKASESLELFDLDSYDDCDWKVLIEDLPLDDEEAGALAELVFVLIRTATAGDGDTATDPGPHFSRVATALANGAAVSKHFDRLWYACALAGWRQAQLEVAAAWAKTADEVRELALEVARRAPRGEPTPQLVSRLEYRGRVAATMSVGWAALASGRLAVRWDSPPPLSVQARTIGTEIAATFWSRRDEAHEGARPAGREPDPPRPVGQDTSVFVVARATDVSTYGKDVARAVKDIAGRDVPLIVGPSPAGLAATRRELVDAWPYAAAVVDALLSDVVPGRGVRLRPTLVVGPPGSGKSRLLRTLSSALALPLSTLDGGACSDQAIVGSPRRWRDSYPSLPISAIVQSGLGNPTLLIDELEKAGTSSAGSLHDALLGLLERDTARSWRDQYLDAQVDVSWCNWLFTANSTTGLPAPLLGRLRVLRMPPPRVADVPVLARTLLRELLKENHVDRRLEPDLDAVELEAVAAAFATARGGSLRELRRIVEAALVARAMAPKH